MCETYTPAEVFIRPSGSVVELPLQIETERVDVVFGITINVVVIVESHPAALAMCETYTPAEVFTSPSGRVVELPLQIETERELDELANKFTFTLPTPLLQQPEEIF